jgi:hypothetical protein
MGEVKEAVKGTPKRKLLGLGKSEANLVSRIRDMRDELSELVTKKDDDVLSEGDDLKPENLKKAAHLRAAHSLLTTVQTLLEDY